MLTKEDAQVAVAQTSKVIQGVASNMKIEIDSALDLKRFVYLLIFLSADGMASTEGVRQIQAVVKETTANISELQRWFFRANCFTPS